jgi:hypothetical protein
MLIEVMVLALTVTVAVPETPESVAVIVLAPALSAVTTPPADMPATAAFEENQVTDEVRFWVDPSL